MIPPPHLPPTPQTRKTYVCRRAPFALTLDGRLDKPFWAASPWTDDFVDIEGSARPLPRHRTRAKMLWDDEYLYIGAEIEEPHVWGTLTQRDSIVFHDNDFEVFLNPTGDNHNYYEIEVNALNTIFDLFLPKPYRDGGPADHAWDCVGMKSAVHIDGTLNDPGDHDRGWSVEFALPWRAFDRHAGVNCPPEPGAQWRVNFSRVQWDLEIVNGAYRKVEAIAEHNWVWSPQGIVDMHRPEQWGLVQFTSNPPGTDPLIPDPSWPARDALYRVYYAQKACFARHDRWASSLDDLEQTHPGITSVPPGCDTPTALSLSIDGWIARQSLFIPGVGVRAWCISQDSRVWCDTDSSDLCAPGRRT